MTTLKTFLWGWFRFWAYIHCTATLIGFIIYSPSTWWSVASTDEYYLLTFAGAMLYHEGHRLLKAWQKANTPEPEFTFEEISEEICPKQIAVKGGAHE